MAGERDFPKGNPPSVVDMPGGPGRPVLPGKPGAPAPDPTPITDPPTRKPGAPPGDDRRENPLPPPPGGTPPKPDEPGRPVPPGTEPTPIDLDGRGTDPAKENPDPNFNFDKGRVRDVLLPGGMWSPTDPGGLGAFNPFNTGFGSAGGRNVGGLPGGSGGTQGGPRGLPTQYDPLGIGQSNYGLSRPIGNRSADGSAENVYSMTGVNAATGYSGPARYGVVGGQGGYGGGMVGPEYTGPQFSDANDVMKAYRKQKRMGERAQRARPVGGAGVVNGPGGFGPAGGAEAGGQNMNGAGKPGAPSGAAGTSGGKPGAPAETTGAPSGAQPEPALANGQNGKPGAPAPTPSTDQQGAGFGANAGGWNPLTTPTSMGNMYETEWGRLVPSSTGNQNVFQLENDPTRLFHYDPNAQNGPGAKNGWKSMTPESYRSYGDYNYRDPRQFGAAASPMQQSWEKKNGLIQGQVGTGSYA